MSRKFILYLLIVLLPAFSVAENFNTTTSVLSAGKWYKLAVTQTGIYRITYAELVAMGIDPSKIDISRFRLFGNGSGMLPEVNSSPRIDDLREIAIEVSDGGDGHFDAGDFLLFYGESADKWVYEKLTRFFSHQRNIYSDTTYYYLNFDQTTGLRVKNYPYLNASSSYTSTRFDNPQSHELDLQNLIRSGRDWYGETFDNVKNTYTFPFYFPYVDNTVTARVRIAVAAKCYVPAYFYLVRNGVRIDSLRVDSTKPQETTIAGRPRSKLLNLSAPDENMELSVMFDLPSSSSVGWLNYLDVTATRNLVWVSPQMSFRDVNSVGPGKLTEFQMQQSGQNVRIWDVTDPSKIRDMQTVIESGIQKFQRSTDTLREFIAFDGAEYLQVKFAGQVSNQNLHALEPATMIIVTHPLFLDQAERLARHHRQGSGISVRVVKVNEIFNEFSCGQPDPTAIRDFVRMLYTRAGVENKPRYLLLFGDGSYDPKDRVPGNNNLIPTFQSIESLNSTTTFVTDDYFGIMAANSGQEANGSIDIGIGRFPVSTESEATDMVDKIIHYSETTYPVRSSWRNIITFMADDEDDNLHMHQAEEMVDIVAAKYPNFNINKIYFDAYKLVNIPGGQRFPDANTAVNNTVDKGSLIINYTGHGGETGWSFEKVTTTADILSWKNRDKLPVFVTATCEFSRFDNPERYTAGEMLINQPAGGAIALYSTTRLAFAGMNIQLNTSFFRHLMDKDTNGQVIKMGDLIRLSKNDINNHFQLRNFVLLGDPVQSIAFPEYNVKTLTINGRNANEPDTALGLSTVIVKGQIEDGAGSRISDFTGNVNCKVYDKPVVLSTLGNKQSTSDSYPEKFSIRNSVLFSGDVQAVNGEFEITFVVPKGISLQYGSGKLSFYASNDQHDASGFSEMICIGGKDPAVNPENEGPAITVSIYPASLSSAVLATSSPILYAELADTNGINWVGLGIGHEITAVIDNDRPHSLVLNDYYVPVFGSYTRGYLSFQLPELLPGSHTLKLKAWDMFDNSSEKEVVFYIESPPSLTVTNVKTGPNPMTDFTRFYFEPNAGFTNDLDITIRIHTTTGILVRTIKSVWSMPMKSSVYNSVYWDGTDDSGKKLVNGLYIYKVYFSDTSGEHYETSQKLMITR